MYVLDGLHEDLNKVKTKKTVENIESDGNNNQEVAKKSWNNHLLRN